MGWSPPVPVNTAASYGSLCSGLGRMGLDRVAGHDGLWNGGSWSRAVSADGGGLLLVFARGIDSPSEGRDP